MKIQQLAVSLGYAGLIPFVVFSIATWIDLPFTGNAGFVLIAYAAVILSFMGAVHWGVAMSRDSEIAVRQLGLSVVPALLGWTALLLPPLFGFLLLALAFAALCAADKLISDHHLLPEWYWPMRVVLTSVVVFCLLASALSAVVQ